MPFLIHMFIVHTVYHLVRVQEEFYRLQWPRSFNQHRVCTRSCILPMFHCSGPMYLSSAIWSHLTLFIFPLCSDWTIFQWLLQNIVFQSHNICQLPKKTVPNARICNDENHHYLGSIFYSIFRFHSMLVSVFVYTLRW